MKKSKSTINSYSELLLIKQDLKRKVNSQERNIETTYLLASKIFQLIKASQNDKKNKTNKEVHKLLYPYINELTSKLIDYKDNNKKGIINVVLSIVIATFATNALSGKINNIFNKKDKQKKYLNLH